MNPFRFSVRVFSRVAATCSSAFLRNAFILSSAVAMAALHPLADAQTVVTTIGTGTAPKAAAVNPLTNKIYVANSGSGSVTVIDGNTAGAATVTVGSNPSALAVNPATNKIYVANQGDGTVTVIDGVTNSTTGITVGSTPSAVAVNPSTNRIYVANSGSGSVTAINGSTGTVVTTISVGTTPVAIAVNPVTNRIYVANSGSSSVSIIDGVANTATTVAAGTQPSAIAVNPAVNKAYATNLGGGITIIDGSNVSTTVVANASSAVTVNPVTSKVYAANTASNSITQVDVNNLAGTVPAGPTTTHATAVAVDPQTNTIYVADGGGAAGRLTALNGTNNSILAFLATGLGPSALALNPVTHRLYVVDQARNDVTVIDCASNAAASIAVGGSPTSVALNPATNKIYVANGLDATVTVVNGANNSTSLVTVGATPAAVDVNPITNKIYIANEGDNTVSVIDGATNIASTVSVGNLPEALAVNPATNKIYVANTLDGTVSVIDGVTNTAATVTVGLSPLSISVNSATNKIYVANFGDGTVSAIDGVTGATTTITVGTHPHAIAVNSITDNIYVANESGTVTVIDGTTSATTSVTAGTLPFAIAANPFTNKIYVTNLNSGDITVIDGVTNSPSTIPAGTKPGAVAVNPVTNKIYVVNRGDGISNGSLTIIDGATDTTSTITAGLQPAPIAINPVTNNVYVVGQSSNDLLILSPLPLQATPLSTTVTPLPGNTTTSSTPSFQFSATSTFAPTAPPVRGVYFQFDTWQGTWIAASNNGGTFSGTAPALSAGTHVLYALAVDGQHGTSTVTGGNSNPLTGTIASYLFRDTATGNATTTTVSSSLNPSDTGQSITFTANVTSVAGTPSGTVTFFDGSSSLGASSLVGGQATLSSSALSAGSHSITANYSGNTTFGGSVSAVLTQTVNGQATSTVLTSSLNPSTVGDSVTFTAAVTGTGGTPTGTVKFFDGTSNIGSGTLTAGQATLALSALTAGSHSITAAYQGDSTFNPSTSASVTQEVDGDPTTIALASSLNPSAFGQSVTFNATVTSAAGTPSGTVTFFDGAAAIGTGALVNGQVTFTTPDLTAVVHSITATYSGNATFAASTSASVNQTVNTANTSTALSSSANPASVGQAVTFTAAVTSAGGTPTGAVLFFDGANQVGTGTLNAAGQAAFTTSTLALGAHPMTASYQTDGNFASSTSVALSQSINSATATTTTLATSANPARFAQSVTFTATVSGGAGTPTGTVNFFDGSTSIGSGILSAGKATVSTALLGVGVHSITAQYAGTVSFTTSTSAVLSQSVIPAATTTAVSASTNPVNAGVSVTFTAAVTTAGGTPSGTVSFLDGTANLGTGTLDVGGHAIFSTSALTTGLHSITAKYSGSTNFSVSTSAALVETVNTPPPPDFTIGPSTGGATTATVKAGQQASYSLAMGLANGSIGSVNVNIICSGAPAKASCVVPAGSVAVSDLVPTIFTVNVTTTANAALLPLGSSKPREPLKMMPLISTLVIGSLLFWAIVTRNVRSKLGYGFQVRKFAPALPAFALLISLAVIAGCGGGGGGGPVITPTPSPTPTPTAAGTPPGTYTLTITVTSSSNTHVQQLTLTVQ